MSGIKEATNQPHRYIVEKNEAIKGIVGLIKDSTYVRSDKDSKGRDFVYHYFKININGRDSFAVIRENLQDDAVHFYSIVEKLKK